MAWENLISELVSQNVLTSWQTLNPHEGVHIHFSRGTVTGDLTLVTFLSPDGGSTVPDVGAYTVVLDSADDEVGWPLSAPVFSFACKFTGAAGNGTFRFRKNGGLVL